MESGRARREGQGRQTARPDVRNANARRACDWPEPERWAKRVTAHNRRAHPFRERSLAPRLPLSREGSVPGICSAALLPAAGSPPNAPRQAMLRCVAAAHKEHSQTAPLSWAVLRVVLA